MSTRLDAAILVRRLVVVLLVLTRCYGTGCGAGNNQSIVIIAETVVVLILLVASSSGGVVKTPAKIF
jgi:hypothetical protein